MGKSGICHMTHTGGCQCGAVRYKVSGDLLDALICHCRMCQKAFGNWGAALVTVEIENLVWTKATPACFRSSEIVTRGFCENCGTPLFMHEDGDRQIEIAIGSLDHPDSIKQLTRQSGVESKLAWFDTMHKLPAETTENYRSAADLAKLKSRQHPDQD